MGQTSPETTDSRESEVATAEPVPTRRKRRRRRRSSSNGKRLRVLYFTLSSAWGFTAGTVAVLACFQSSGKPWTLGMPALALLAGAGVLALVGGVVAALAYNDASKRLG